MTPVFVLSMNGTKLMPTTRLGRVRHLLKDGKAEIACRKPFTIRLLYPSTEYVQYLELGVDSGYENVGLSLKTERRELMSSEHALLADEKSRHDDRRAYRRTRRNRKRHREPRFDNRKREEGWIAPSLKHKKEAQEALIVSIGKVAPVTRVVVEVGVFDTALLSAMQTTGEPPHGEDYQHGPLYYADNLRAAVFQRDNYACRICRRSALKNRDVHLHLHHALYWKGRHADTLNECITVCAECHSSKNHKPGGKLWGLEPNVPRLEGAAFMNAVRWKLVDDLIGKLPDIDVRHAYGSETARKRKELGLEKSHANDAYCIGEFHPARRAETGYFVKKRRNNRVLEKFYDAKIVDVRDGKVKPGQELGCNRTSRREPRNSDRNCREFRGQRKSLGQRRIRRRRHGIQPGDIVVFRYVKYAVKGMMNNGKTVLLMAASESPTGKAVTASVAKVHVVRHCSGWMRINQPSVRNTRNTTES